MDDCFRREKKFKGCRTLAGQLSLHVSFRAEAVNDLANAIIASVFFTVQGSDTTLFYHFDTALMNVHLAICLGEKSLTKRDNNR